MCYRLESKPVMLYYHKFNEVKRAYESAATPNDASHPFHWGDVQGRGVGRRMAAIEGRDRNPTAIQSYFQKITNPGQ
jgi:hypothetical protein